MKKHKWCGWPHQHNRTIYWLLVFFIALLHLLQICRNILLPKWGSWSSTKMPLDSYASPLHVMGSGNDPTWVVRLSCKQKLRPFLVSPMLSISLFRFHENDLKVSSSEFNNQSSAAFCSATSITFKHDKYLLWWFCVLHYKCESRCSWISYWSAKPDFNKCSQEGIKPTMFRW